MHLAFPVTQATHVWQSESRLHPSHLPHATRRALFPADGALPLPETVVGAIGQTPPLPLLIFFFLFNPSSISISDSLKVVALLALPGFCLLGPSSARDRRGWAGALFLLFVFFISRSSLNPSSARRALFRAMRSRRSRSYSHRPSSFDCVFRSEDVRGVGEGGRGGGGGVAGTF